MLRNSTKHVTTISNKMKANKNSKILLFWLCTLFIILLFYGFCGHKSIQIASMVIRKLTSCCSVYSEQRMVEQAISRKIMKNYYAIYKPYWEQPGHMVESLDQINSLSDQYCTWGMIHSEIHLISSGCLWPNIALQVQNCGLKHHSFITSI